MPSLSAAHRSATSRIIGSVAYLDVGNGLDAIIDAEDVSRVCLHRWKAWKRAASKNGERMYVQAGIEGKTTYLHRLIMDAPTGVCVDHINHDTLDNRKENLRLVTHQVNDMNRDGAYNTSKTGVRGVSIHRCRPSDLRYYVFRCHGKYCKASKCFPYTDDGFRQAKDFAEAHHASVTA